jgi:hypothetical protein
MERIAVYTEEASRGADGSYMWEVGPVYVDTVVYVIEGARPIGDLTDDTVLDCFAETDTELEG